MILLGTDVTMLTTKFYEVFFIPTDLLRFAFVFLIPTIFNLYLLNDKLYK